MEDVLLQSALLQYVVLFLVPSFDLVYKLRWIKSLDLQEFARQEQTLSREEPEIFRIIFGILNASLSYTY